jgi:YheC/D like ATP-grasp
MPIRRYQVKSKSTVAYVLQSHPDTKGYLPATEILGRERFYRMVQTYKIVYLKPDGGRKSRGVLRVEQKHEGSYRLRKSEQRDEKQFTSLQALWSEVNRLTSGTRYIIQQGINSVTKDRRYFDLRCHALRIDGKWEVAGICARVGSPGNIVTTSHIGGTPTLMEKLFTDLLGYSKHEQKEVMEKLHDCILHAVKAVSPLYPKNWEFAVDIGLDTDQNVWIYEVNIEPAIRGNFRMLPDQTLYRKIKSLRKIAK